MAKHILVTSTDLMMVQFLTPHLQYLKEHGYMIDAACSNVGGRIEEVREKLEGIVSTLFVVRLHRSPLNAENISGYHDLKKILSQHRYDLIWTNEPVMGVMTRLAAKKSRKQGTKVIYMVHGFHFYNGAPALNWTVYYPIEKAMTHYCDVITTINKEDYDRAEKMSGPEVRYIHGIGMNTERFAQDDDQESIRKTLGLSDDAFLLLTVAEIQPHKNQEIIVKAMAKLNDKNVHYLLCGKGTSKEALEKLAEELNVSGQLHFLGYRKDLASIYRQSDVFAFPTIREGLGLACLEAMYCGLPVLSSNTRGPKDYMVNGKTGYMYDPDDADGFAEGIKTLKENSELRKQIGNHNQSSVKPFCLEEVKNEVLSLIEEYAS